MSDNLDKLARQVVINELDNAERVSWRNDRPLYWANGSYAANSYTKEQVIQRRKELINKPTEWPEWAKFLAQDQDGKWFFYLCKPRLSRERWIPTATSAGKVVFHQHGETLDDWAQSLQERPATNAIDAGMKYPSDFEHKNNGQPVVDAAPEWDGNGLPPIGCKVEYVENDELIADEFVQFWSGGDALEVLCHAPNGDGMIAVVHNPRFVGATSLVNGCMRPVEKRTDKEKAVDEMAAVLKRTSPQPEALAAWAWKSYAGALYDAGYRKQLTCDPIDNS